MNRFRGIWVVAAAVGLVALAGLWPASAQTQGDPLRPAQWHLDRIRAPAAWDVSRGQDVLVAVLDTGVDANHEDLVGRVVPGTDLVDQGTEPNDTNGRGTQIAGIVAAVTDNGTGVASVAPGARILPVRVVDDSGRSTEERIAEGVRYAVDEAERTGSRLVILLSLTDVPSAPSTGLAPSSPDGEHPVEDAVRNAWADGALVVVAWDTGADVRSGEIDGVALLVGSTDRDDRPTWRSGQEPDVVAPGDGIVTTTYDPDRPADHAAYTCADESCTTGTASGTSLAAGHAAGTAALLMAAGRTNDQAMAAIIDTAASPDPDGGCDPRMGCGLIDAGRAVRYEAAARATARPAPTPSDPAAAARRDAAGGTDRDATAPAVAQPAPSAPPTPVAPTPYPDEPTDHGPRVDRPRESRPLVPALAFSALLLAAGGAAWLAERRRPRLGEARVPAGHIPALDGLRGIAVITIVVYHGYQLIVLNADWMQPGRRPPMWAWPLQVGFLGVDLFFVLSGFLLATSWLRLRTRGPRATREYAARRALRILPAYWVMLLVLVPLRAPQLLSWDGLPILGVFATLQQYLDPELPWAVNAVTWSLTPEVHFYLVVPLLAVLLLHVGALRTVGLFVATTVLWRVGVHPLGDEAEWIFGRLDQFAAGMAGALLVGDHLAGRTHRALDVLRSRWAGLALWGALIWVGLHSGAYYYGRPLWLDVAIHPVTGIAMAGLLTRAILTGRTSRLENRALTWFGLISYSLYLWHWPLLTYVLNSGLRGRQAMGPVVGLIAASVVVAAASYYLVERMALRIKRRRRGSKGRPEPAGGPKRRDTDEVGMPVGQRP